jgi:tetratricopeptide (TPR) repeat protein
MRPPRPPRPPPPSSASAAFARGAELQQTGRFAEALQCFEQILSRAPADPLALWQSGRTLFMLKQIDRAIGRLEQAAAVRSGHRL